MLYIAHKLYVLIPVLSRHFGHLVDARLVLFPSTLALSYSGKVTEAFPFTPSGYEMALKIVAWGVFFTPISTKKVKTHKLRTLFQIHNMMKLNFN